MGGSLKLHNESVHVVFPCLHEGNSDIMTTGVTGKCTYQSLPLQEHEMDVICGHHLDCKDQSFGHGIASRMD